MPEEGLSMKVPLEATISSTDAPDFNFKYADYIVMTLQHADYGTFYGDFDAEKGNIRFSEIPFGTVNNINVATWQYHQPTHSFDLHVQTEVDQFEYNQNYVNITSELETSYAAVFVYGHYKTDESIIYRSDVIYTDLVNGDTNDYAFVFVRPDASNNGKLTIPVVGYMGVTNWIELDLADLKDNTLYRIYVNERDNSGNIEIDIDDSNIFDNEEDIEV